MALAISVYPEIYRNDSSVFPIATTTDAGADAYIKVFNWLYLPLLSAVQPLLLPNRTLKTLPIYVRNTFHPATWEMDSGMVHDTSDNSFSRSSGESYNGVHYDTPLNADKCSIQATATSTSLSTGISLQDESDAISHNYNDATVRHSITLGQNGQGSIRENGAFVANNGYFQYEVGDTAMIELIDGIVRYYLVKADFTMKLLRTTRSKLTEAPKAEATLYFTGSRLENVLLFDGDEASDTIENIGVAFWDEFLENSLDWQRWENQMSRASTADILEMADKRTEATFPNQKTILKSLALTPFAKDRFEYWQFVDFVEWHGNEKEFIFVDHARRDANNNPTEFWAKFSGAFVDATKNKCIFQMSQAIVEDFRNDYIPVQKDIAPPNIALSVEYVSEGFKNLIATVFDDNYVNYVEFYLDDILLGTVFNDGTNEFILLWDVSEIGTGDYVVKAIAYDFAGNSAFDTLNLSVDALTDDGDPLFDDGDPLVDFDFT